MAGKNWIHSFLSQQEITQIANVVEREERKTAGEIVTVIVRRSSYIGHIPLLATVVLLIGFLFLGGFEWIRHQFGLHFSSHIAVTGPYLVFAFVGLVFWFLVNTIKDQKWLQRLLITQKDQMEQVEKRAFLEYYLNHVTNTKSKTGILIFISLMEQKTIVLADESISKKLPPETWQEVVDKIVSGVKTNRTAEGLVQAIEVCGSILATHFPTVETNKNELPNHLIIKD